MRRSSGGQTLLFSLPYLKSKLGMCQEKSWLVIDKNISFEFVRQSNILFNKDAPEPSDFKDNRNNINFKHKKNRGAVPDLTKTTPPS